MKMFINRAWVGSSVHNEMRPKLIRAFATFQQHKEVEVITLIMECQVLFD